MLEVQKWLRAGNSLEELTNKYAIMIKSHGKYPNLKLLKYNQIMSNMGYPIVQECRGLILDQADDWKLISLPFKKFFNIEERDRIPKDFDFKDFKSLNKLDGSLIQIYFYNYMWEIGTSGTPDAAGDCGPHLISFRDLVQKTIEDQDPTMLSRLDQNCCYSFELLAPENQVVVYHPTRSLILTGVRDVRTGIERDIWTQVPEIDNAFKVGYEYLTMDEVNTRVKEMDGSKEEGFVLLDNAFNRIKAKSPSYVFFSRSRDQFAKSPRSCVELILHDKVDDVIGLLPEFVVNRIHEYTKKVQDLASKLDSLYSEFRDIEDDKDFALKVQHTGYAKFMFAMRKNGIDRGLDAIIWMFSDSKGNISVNRKAMETLKIYDQDEVEE